MIIDYSKSEAERNLLTHPDPPVLFVYMSDVWGCSVIETSEHEHRRLLRKGRHRAEILLESGMVKFFDNSGRIVKKPIIVEPRGLSLGKLAWDCFTGACQFFPLLGFLGVEILF